MFTSIIVPVDGSEPSNAAIDLAAALSKACGATLTLCHVVRTPRPMHDAGGFAREQMMQDETHAGHAVLDAASKRAAAQGITAATVLQSGTVAEGILAEARERGCDAIVMGSRGRGTLARAVLGSAASDIISQASIPVIVAPHAHG